MRHADFVFVIAWCRTKRRVPLSPRSLKLTLIKSSVFPITLRSREGPISRTTLDGQSQDLAASSPSRPRRQPSDYAALPLGAAVEQLGGSFFSSKVLRVHKFRRTNDELLRA